MRSLLTKMATIGTAVAATLFVTTAGYAAQATLNCPGTAQAGPQFATEVTVNVGTTPLGAYGITVTYDATVLTIASVAGGNTAEFSGVPTTDATSFTTGTTKISAFQASSLTGPTGVVSIDKITFNVVGTASTTTAIGLTVRSLYDTSSNPISATSSGCMVQVTGTATTTIAPTTTTTVTSTTSTAPPPTTTTTPPCTTARCTLGAALMSPACAGQTIPASVTGKLSAAENLIDQAATASGNKTRTVRQKARTLLRQAGAKATHAAKRKKPKLAAACAAALKDAAAGVAANL